MYIPGFISYATNNSTYHRYDHFPMILRLRKPVLDLLCCLSDAKYYKDELNSHLRLVHMYLQTLFLQDAFNTMVCSKATDGNIKNPHRRGSCQTKVVYRESVSLQSYLQKVRTGLNATFPENQSTLDSLLEVPFLENAGRPEGGCVPMGDGFQHNDAFFRGMLCGQG